MLTLKIKEGAKSKMWYMQNYNSKIITGGNWLSLSTEPRVNKNRHNRGKNGHRTECTGINRDEANEIKVRKGGRESKDAGHLTFYSKIFQSIPSKIEMSDSKTAS